MSEQEKYTDVVVTIKDGIGTIKVPSNGLLDTAGRRRS